MKQINGFSIVSIFALLVLASMLFAGFIRLYQNSQPSADANFNTIIYNPSFSWIFFNNNAMELGANPFASPIISKPYDTIIPLFAPRSTLIKVSSADVNGSDTFTLQYQGNDEGTALNCQGTPLLANQQTESFYYINENNDLVCASKNHEAKLEKAYPVMKNVESMVIRLGVDQSNDGLVNSYVEASSPELSYDKIVSIRVSLLLRTNQTSENLTSHQYYNLDGEERGPYPDLYIRKVLTTTIPLKKRTDP